MNYILTHKLSNLFPALLNMRKCKFGQFRAVTFFNISICQIFNKEKKNDGE